MPCCFISLSTGILSWLVTTLTLELERRLLAPLVYQSTTSLGLGQVQMPRPKEVVATGAAARGSKKWYNFFC